MPRHEPKSDEAIEVRSVLMRLYHSRQMGEAFYPAQLVNGHAPQMEADGWIEWCGQGWRLTDAGLKVWAEMNPSLITYKFQNNKQFFEEMRHVLRGEDEMANQICVVEGCGQPQYVTEKGERHSRCEKHQREKWRKEAEVKRVKKANQPPPQPSPASDGGSSIPELYREPARPGAIDPLPMDAIEEDISASGGSPFEIFAMHRFADHDKRQVGEPIRAETIKAAVQEAQAHDCETCEAKAIIGMLKARSPKLAALIEAMEEVQRKADDLGL